MKQTVHTGSEGQRCYSNTSDLALRKGLGDDLVQFSDFKDEKEPGNG